MTDISEPFADSRAQNERRCERVGVDFGPFVVGSSGGAV
jgi:hypothetical protein